jgi:hypothetical protein
MNKFKRTISFNDPIREYKINNIEDSLKTINNCHFGAIKLFYSEVEFLLKCNKYIDINECLVLYIGAQPGYRIKHLFIKEYFPKIKMLLYDPLKFDIEEDEQIIIKTGKDGWFDDDTIQEVLKIANGRKILYMSDIRETDENAYKKEVFVYEDMIKQQRWAIKLGAEFILLKFRMFFYQNDPSDIDFIRNEENVNKIKDNVIFQYDDKKHNVPDSMLYFSGKIYSQILAGARSTETRLFVKKIKYHENIDEIVKFSNEPKDIVGEKYLLRYYSSIKYEGILNYFNIITRQQSFSDDTNRISDYIIGLNDDYTAYTIYYITTKWMKLNNKPINLESVLEQIIKTLTFFYKRYTNNFAICRTVKLFKKINYKKDSQKKDLEERKNLIRIRKNLIRKKLIKENLKNNIEKWNKQIKNLNTLKIDRFIINDYIKSHKVPKNLFFEIKDNIFVLAKNQE